MNETTPTAAPANAPTKVVPPREILVNMLEGLGIPATVEQSTHNGNVTLHITTEEPGRLIGRHGQTLSQLQFLVNRILLRVSIEAPRVTLDCEHYREKLRDDIVSKAQEAADRVRRWGEPVHIGPFNSFDRRAIHQHFATDSELEAVSDGGDEGGMKKMTVRIKSATPA